MVTVVMAMTENGKEDLIDEDCDLILSSKSPMQDLKETWD